MGDLCRCNQAKFKDSHYGAAEKRWDFLGPTQKLGVNCEGFKRIHLGVAEGKFRCANTRLQLSYLPLLPFP